MIAIKILFGILINLDFIILIIGIFSVLNCNKTKAKNFSAYSSLKETSRWFKRTFSVGIKQLFVLGTVFVFLVPVPRLLFHHFEMALPRLEALPSDMKGFILLGGNFMPGDVNSTERPQYNMASGRLIEFVNLAKQNTSCPIVLTGNPYEAKWMKQILTEMGISENRFIVEGQSKNTEDNAQKSYTLVKPKADEKWVLVTSAFHMPRSYGLFKKMGWNVVPCPVDYHTPTHWTYKNFFLAPLDRLGQIAWRATMMEVAGLVNYYLEGKTESLWPVKQ